MGLHCCLSFAHAAVSGTYSLVVVGGLLIAVTPLVGHGLQGEWASAGAALRLQSSGSVALERRLSCYAACGILLDQGSNPCLLHGRVDSLPLNNQRSPFLIIFNHLKEGPPNWELGELSSSYGSATK